MNKSIPIPNLLQNQIARELNTKMLTNNQSFVFLGEPEVMINRTPSTFAEAFDMYIIRLYVLYHDYGMKFLECYGNVSLKHSYILHIRFVNSCRALLGHSTDPMQSERVYNSLKKHYFRNDASFRYNDWQDFWENAPESHWERLVEQIVKDSNSVMKYLENVAFQNPNYVTDCKNISEIFTKTRVYSEASPNGRSVDVYLNSLDSRFLKQICLQLKRTYSWTDEEKAKQELRAFYSLESKSTLSGSGKLTPNQMREELIKTMMSSLENNDYTDSELLFQSIGQRIKLLIDNQINKDILIDEDDILDP